MAARGRFGRSDTGTSNLSALIRQLVAQQASQEEQAIMNAFYSGVAYNGSVPTMADVTAFYNKYMTLTGIEKGTAEWNLIQQKIGDANNADISRQYQKLSTEFETSNGANFGEFMSFLKGRAQESTNQDHLNSYNKSISAIAKNYVSYQRDSLIKGFITMDQYQSMVDSALSSLDASDPMRQSILGDSFDAKWAAMNSKQQKKLAIGKLSVAGYVAWAKQFAQSILDAGFNKENDTYLSALAAAATVGGRGGGGGGGGVAAKTSGELAGIWSTIRTKYSGGTDTFFYPGETMTTSAMLKEIAANPDWVQRFAMELDANPGSNDNIWNKQTGKDGGEAFLEWWGGLLKTGVDVTKNSGGAIAAQWLAAEQNAGTSTYWRVIQTATEIWEADLVNSGQDGQQVGYLKAELTKFLQGQNSKYGKLPTDPRTDPNNILTPQQRTLVQNQLLAMNGGYVEGMQTVSSVGKQTTAETTAINDLFASAMAIEDIANQLQDGTLVNYWTKDNSEAGGHWVADKPTAVGAANGKYSYVSVTKSDEGVTSSQVRVADTQPVLTFDETTGKYKNSGFFWTFIPDSQETIFVDSFGKAYSKDAFVTIGKDGYAVDRNKTTNDFKLAEAPKRVFYTDESTGAVVIGKHGPEDPNSAIISAEDKRVAASAALAAARVGILDPQAAADILGPNGDGGQGSQIYAYLIESSDAQALAELLSTPTDPNDLEKRLAIADYSGNTEYKTFLEQQIKDKAYNEVAPNVWAPVVPQREIGALKAQSQLGAWYAQQNPVVQTLAALPVGIAGAAAAIGGFGDILLGGVNKPVVDMRTPEQKAADEARGLKVAAPQVQSLEQTGYGRAPGDQFFRNLNISPVSVAPVGSSYLNLQATVPTPVAVKPVTPAPSGVKIVGAPGFGAVITAPKPPKIISSGPRAGQPAGGGL